MQESLVVSYLGKDYPCQITYKRMRSIRFRFNREGTLFVVSCPFGTPRAFLTKEIARFLPRMAKSQDYEKPVQGSEVYLFGKKAVWDHFIELPAKKQEELLKQRLLPILEERVGFFEKQMGIDEPYLVKIRTMKSRYGVNDKNKKKLTFTTSLVHYSLPIIDSVVVHELAHDFVRDHSPRFYRIVFQFCPDYKLNHAKLRKHIYE